MLYICKSYDVDIWCKFEKDDVGYFNVRMHEEATKRKNYSESRKNNRKPKHMKNISESYVNHNGKFMESYFGMEGASKRPELDFIIDPSLNQAYQQLRMGVQQMQAQQQALGLQGQQMQLEMQQAQMQQAAQGGQQPQQGQPQQQPEEQQKSEDVELEKAWEESMKTNHESLLKSWLRIHDLKIDEE